ncbi:hypothetical protein G9A89_003192 [Geosiphon pyriformis]|nr:hypothetical protein G9A89_003192 [Geosiphon pyriformis]
MTEYSIEDSLPGGILAIKLRKKLTKLRFWEATEKTITIESLTNKHHPKVAESKNIRANHLGFAKSLFQHYCQHLRLNHNHISTESAFNFYVNKKISSLLGTLVNTESARETFYRELIQNTNLPTNHNFVSIIIEINKEIKHYIQQRYPITYINKGKYFKEFKTTTLWELSEEEEEKKLEDQEFTYQNLILENLEFGAPNPIQIPNQQTQQPPPQQQQMAYAPIAKLDKFTSEEDDAQVWLNDIEKAITVNGWNNARAILVDKSQDFNAFKLEFLRYFSNNNSINRLANTFTTIKQKKTKAVTTYLGCFHRNLRQIQAINANYFTVPQILNQFICGLYSSILQHVCPLHPAILQDTVTHAKDFESAELEANHAHTMNLIMNGLSELDSKLKQFRNANCFQNQSHPSSSSAAPNQLWQPEMCICHNCATNLSTTSISTSNLLIIATSNLSATTPKNLSIPINSDTAPKFNLELHKTGDWQWFSSNLPSRLCSRNSGTGATQNLNSQNYLSLLVTLENATNTNLGFNQQLTLISNIPPATITEDKSLAAIFSFEIEKPSRVLLFSGATIKEKPIMAIYTDVKIDGYSIKLILNSCRVDHAASARIITANGATKTPIGKIDDLSIEINGITVLIKVLVMEATQYQVLNTQELQLSQNSQYTQVSAMCGHFKSNNVTSLTPLINFEKKKPKPTWEAYQILWANIEHNELPPILDWEEKNNVKGKRTETEEHTCETTIDTWNNDDENKATPTSWKEKGKGKEKEKDLLGKTNKITEKITSGWEKEYLHKPVKEPPYIPLKCQDCKKKLSSMEAWIVPDEDYWMQTYYYCKPCHKECYGYPK